MRRKKRRSVGPIYTFALIWLGCTLFIPLLRLSAWLITAGLALGGAAAVAVMLKKKAQPSPAEEAPVQEEETVSCGGPVDEIMQDGKLAMSELGRLYASIPDAGVKQRINAIMAVSDKIVRHAIDDPHDAPKIRKFLDYYMPTTLKLLNAYDRMAAQEIDGENISGSKQRITEMLDTTIEAYEKHLDSLFANQALDIDAEIRAMEGMLAREGLAGSSYLDIKDYLKKYNNEEKGSTQNG